MTVKRTLYVVLCLVLLAGVISGCGAKQPVVVKEGPILVGCTLPLTGPYAETGRYVLEGYEYWVEETNANGGLLGREVVLEVLDDQSDPAQAVALVENLISQKKVDLLIGGYPGVSAAAQMAVAEQHGKVYVSMGGHMTSFTQGFTYSFGAPPLMGEWWYVGFFDYLKTLPREEWPTKAAMVTVNNAVGHSVRASALEALNEMGIEIVVDELYDLPLAAAEPLVNKAKVAGAELFLANGFFADGVQTVRAIHALDYKPKAILQGIGTLVPSWIEELGEDGNYIFSGTAMHSQLPFEGVAHLNEISQTKYGTPAPPYFMFGYAWMQALGQGVEGAGSLDQDAIRDWLKSNTIETVGGTFTFDERGLPPDYSYCTQVVDGRPTLVWPKEITSQSPVYPIPY
jgi:branched-chain amino acid transport system substrate-binding protein